MVGCPCAPALAMAAWWLTAHLCFSQQALPNHTRRVVESEARKREAANGTSTTDQVSNLTASLVREVGPALGVSILKSLAGREMLRLS